MSAHQLRWYQTAGLALAGLSSFTLAAYWNMAPDHETDDMVQPVIRSRAEPAPALPHLRASLDSLSPAGESSLQMSARSDPTSGQVAHNPFGSLNLLAGAELAAGSNSSTVIRTPVSTQVRKPKLEPPPIVVVAEAPPPPPPAAPALPFSVVGGISGQQITEGRPVVFLRLRDEVLVVRQGDEIDKTYRVETITPQKIEFTYLPLLQRQTLSLAP